MFGHKTVGICRKASTIDAMLNNGRTCKADNQCISKRCISGICKGKGNGDNCATRADCDPGLTCNMDLEWPFATKCRALGLTGAHCSDTYDCAPSHFCWYANYLDAQNDNKKCLELNVQPEGAVFGWRYIDSEDGMTNALING